MSSSPVVTATPGVGTYFNEFFVKSVEEKSNGRLKFQYVGATETIAVADQPLATQKGSVDLSMPYCGYVEALVPGAGGLILSQLTPLQERLNGAYDFLVDMHKKSGLYYLGRAGATSEPFFLTWLNKPVTKPEDFVKLRIGSATAARAAVEAWGATHISVGMQDYFTSMDTGLVDGLAGVPLSNWVRQGGQNITKYLINHPYFQNSTEAIMNLDTWNKIPADLQKLIIDTMTEEEKQAAAAQGKDVAINMQKVVDGGCEVVTLPPAFAKWYLDTAFQGSWDYQYYRFPEVTEKMRELMSP